jgi:hypothetical protein
LRSSPSGLFIINQTKYINKAPGKAINDECTARTGTHHERVALILTNTFANLDHIRSVSNCVDLIPTNMSINRHDPMGQ